MSDNSTIEWTDATWNPVTGCTEVSPGCDHCYAKTFAERFRGTEGHHFENGFDVQLRPDKLTLPLSWKKPRRVFVNSMSDLFHDSVPDEYIAEVFSVMARASQHTFQVLTKRHSRMRSLLNKPSFRGNLAHLGPWPLPNVWLGVSVENQQWAGIRIPALFDTLAAVRFLSCEPLLGSVDILSLVFALNGIDWVIVGGESGHGARPMHPNWARQLRDQCVTADTPFLFKQWGEWAPLKQSLDYVTNDDRVQVVSMLGELGGRPWPGHAVQDGWRDAEVMRRYGKGHAGRVLDGRTWDESPGVVA